MWNIKTFTSEDAKESPISLSEILEGTGYAVVQFAMPEETAQKFPCEKCGYLSCICTFVGSDRNSLNMPN